MTLTTWTSAGGGALAASLPHPAASIPTAITKEPLRQLDGSIR
jgi:hypothetical protein